MGRPRVFLTGASGLLGGAVAPLLDAWADVVSPGLDAFDLARPDSIRSAILECEPDTVIHLAAETRVDWCEEHPGETFRINTEGTRHVAVACRDIGARLLYLSTDYVFDGAKRVPYLETDPTAPLGVYGRSKEQAEQAVLSAVETGLVIRSASLFGTGPRHFAASILAQARDDRTLWVVDDQVQSPTWVGHLAPAIVEAARSDIRGILHLTASGWCTWFEFAIAIVAQARLQADIRPTSTQALARPAPRPAYSVLDLTLAREALGIRMPEWQEGLDAFIREGGLG